VFHIANGRAATERTRHRRLCESATLGAFVLGRQERKIVTVTPELGTDQIQILAGTGFILIAVDRPERPTHGGTGSVIGVVIVFGNTACRGILGILWDIGWFPWREIGETNTALIAALDTSVFGERHNVGLAVIAALTGFTVSLYATGGGARVAEHNLVLLFEFGHIIVGRDLEGRFAGRPGCSAAFLFDGGDSRI
jgi:hypothetical protein